MKIRLIKLITGAEGRFEAGVILDLEPANAYSLVAAGAAEIIETETPEQEAAPETAVIKTRRQKK